MKKLPIAEASNEQLRTFAADVQQLASVPQDRNGVLAALVEGGWAFDYIFVGGEEPLALGGADAPVADAFEQWDEPDVPVAEMPEKGFSLWTQPAKGKPKCPMVVCRILPTDRPGGNEPAHPIIGDSPPLVIQRSVWVRIPLDFYLVLKQAGGTALLPGGDNKDFIRQDYSEYPTEVRSMPSRAEVAAWREWIGKRELGHPTAQAA